MAIDSPLLIFSEALRLNKNHLILVQKYQKYQKLVLKDLGFLIKLILTHRLTLIIEVIIIDKFKKC